MPKPKRHKPIVAAASSSKPSKQQKSSHDGSGQLGVHKKTLKATGGSHKTHAKQQQGPNSGGKGRASGGAAGRASSSSGALCANVIHRQAASAVMRLVVSDSTKTKGASLKSLTLASHVQHKKATYAVTCQVLKCECPAATTLPSAHRMHREERRAA